MKNIVVAGLVLVLLSGFGSRFGLGHDANVKRAVKADTHIVQHFYDVDAVDGQAHMNEAGYQLNRVYVESKIQFTNRLVMASSLKEVQQALDASNSTYVRAHIDNEFIKMAHARGNKVIEYKADFSGELLRHAHAFQDIKVNTSNVNLGRCYIEYNQNEKPVSMLLPATMTTEFPGMGAMAVRVSYLIFGERNMAIYADRLQRYQRSGNVLKLLPKDFVSDTFLPEIK